MDSNLPFVQAFQKNCKRYLHVGLFTLGKIKGNQWNIFHMSLWPYQFSIRQFNLRNSLWEIGHHRCCTNSSQSASVNFQPIRNLFISVIVIHSKRAGACPLFRGSLPGCRGAVGLRLWDECLAGPGANYPDSKIPVNPSVKKTLFYSGEHGFLVA